MANAIGNNQVASKHERPQLSRPHRQLRLKAAKPNVDVTVDMGDGPATPTGGFAGWEDVTRVKRRAMTAFVGLPPLTQDVPILVDGYREGRSVQRDVDAILSLGGAVVFTALGPIWWSGSRFVFGDEPEFTEQKLLADETLVRARLVLKLKKYSPPGAVGESPRPHVAIGEAVPLEYTVKQDDTLVTIAIAVYGERGRWKEIGEKNGIRDPHRKLKPGTSLVL